MVQGCYGAWGLVIFCLALLQSPLIETSTIMGRTPSPIIEGPPSPWSSFAAPPYTLRAHSSTCNQGAGGGGANCPTISNNGNGIMNATTNNMKQLSYTGTYNSNGVVGQDEFCGCTPNPLGDNYLSLNGTINTLILNSTFDYTGEITFYLYFPHVVTGENCGIQYTGAHWFDIEVFYLRYNNPSYPTSGWNYNGCGSTSPTTITYREVWNQTAVGHQFTWRNFNVQNGRGTDPITGSVIGRALNFQIGTGQSNVTLNSNVFLTAVEIGTEDWGAILGATYFDHILSVSPAIFSPSCPSSASSPLSQATNGFVTLVPRTTAPYGITIANGYGYVNVTNTQLMSGFQDYPNGTIFFDLRGVSQSRQLSYNYLVHSYGNGTLDLRFETNSQQPRVTAQLAGLTCYLPSTHVQIVDYSSSVSSDPLILTFVGLASQNLFNAAVLASFFFSIIIGTIGLLYVVVIISNVRNSLQVATGRLDGEGTRTPILTIKLTIAGIAAVVGFAVMIILVVYFGSALQGLGF